MNYRGYVARVEYDAEEKIFVGLLAGTEDIVVIHGTSVDELETASHEAVDHYIEVSEHTGRPAQKPHSGRLILRIAAELHAAVAATQGHGKSINQWAAEVLERASQE